MQRELARLKQFSKGRELQEPEAVKEVLSGPADVFLFYL
jgi:hypothetical protein